MSSPSRTPYEWPELVAIVLSRELRDNELGSPGGARSEIPMAAARLAQLSHAPNLAIIASAVGYIINTVDKAGGPLCHSTTDFRNIYAGTEAVLPFKSIFTTGRDWFFAGGLQVDPYGNINMTSIGDIKAPKLRGPGAAGLAFASSMARRYFIYMQEHTPRSFVAKLDYITALGYGSGPGTRKSLGIQGGGPALVISPRAVMDFEPDSCRMRLRSVHPGNSVREVIEQTGFDLVVPDDVPSTPAPTAAELELLRTRVDRQGVLRNLHSHAAGRSEGRDSGGRDPCRR